MLSNRMNMGRGGDNNRDMDMFWSRKMDMISRGNNHRGMDMVSRGNNHRDMNMISSRAEMTANGWGGTSLI